MLCSTESERKIKRYRRGVDLDVDPGQFSNSEALGFDYEQTVFRDLLHRSRPGDFVLGPNLLDAAFESAGIRGGWDAAILFKGTLKAIVEAKRKRHAKWETKLLGFSQNLGLLREDPDLFPKIINTTAGQIILPRPIIVPPDSQIPVLFRSSIGFQRSQATAPNCSLVARFGVVPIPSS